MTPGGRADHQAGGHGHVVIQQQNVDTGPGQYEGVFNQHRCQLIEQVIDYFIALHQIDHEIFKSAQAPGRPK